ncbi:MAG: sigma-70 family RNA polymerase sigma factor [Burkholderiaceae bacterium]|nr:sigma-70 family RNA polymerase sigma factor [Burkholderiaceae bacterium]
MQQYAGGNASSFEVLYQRHRAWLYRVLLRSLHNETAAQDVFQDTWLTVIKTASKYEPRAKFTTWLYGLAHSRLIDMLRKEKAPGRSLHSSQFSNPEYSLDTFNIDEDATDQSFSLDALAPDPAETIAWKQFGQHLEKALNTLPFEQREAFSLWVETELTVEQIACATQSTLEAAKSRLRYARAKLKAALSMHADMAH